MKGHPAGRPRADGTRLRQYQCPAPPDGCAHSRRDTVAADKWVIGHVLAWTAPDGPYAQYAARELALYEASQDAVSAELAGIEAEQAEADILVASIRAQIKAGNLKPGTLKYDTNMEVLDQVEAETEARAGRTAKLRSAMPPARIHERHVTLAATLTDPDGDITVRSDLVRAFVSRVVIRPPGQGVRSTFDTGSIQVIPGAWADGLTAADLAACKPRRPPPPRGACGGGSGHTWRNTRAARHGISRRPSAATIRACAARSWSCGTPARWPPTGPAAAARHRSCTR